jgi:hypothetical protein
MGDDVVGGAPREAPVRTEPHPTRSFALPAQGLTARPLYLSPNDLRRNSRDLGDGTLTQPSYSLHSPEVYPLASGLGCVTLNNGEHLNL